MIAVSEDGKLHLCNRHLSNRDKHSYKKAARGTKIGKWKSTTGRAARVQIRERESAEYHRLAGNYNGTTKLFTP